MNNFNVRYVECLTKNEINASQTVQPVSHTEVHYFRNTDIDQKL
jgi:hypothetical protein